MAICLPFWLQPAFAQKTTAQASPERTRQLLIANAHALESRGRPDMAIQLWQQILLSDPKNTEALAGLARDYKLTGNAPQADSTLERLRSLNPNDPNIAKIQALNSTKAQSDRLRQAGNLARQGHNEEAMRIYRDLYGDHPPDGDIAMAYYQTLYGTASGKETAIGAMRALAQRNPGDTRFAVELGIMLTYEAKTRAEGIRILQAHPQDPNAQTALRQALIWDSANPASAAELRQYLKEHPQDTELAGHLKENESKLAQMNSGIARTPAERAAFAALNAHKLEDAQARFTELLQHEPNNGRVAAGMGFLRMQQNNFAGAISYLTQAEQNGFKNSTVENALETSRFWYTMGEASQAFNENQMDLAAAKYSEALKMRPRSREALSGLAGLLMKQQQYSEAAGMYAELLKTDPRSADAWRGLFLSYARDGQNEKALATINRFPPPVKTAMARDPDYLRTLATIYHAQNRSADAQRVLSQALALPFPDNGANLKQDTRLQYAGILMEAQRFDQAAEMYTQILNDDSGNLPAWMGLVSAHHELKQDNEAINDVEKMPPTTYESALSDVGFLSMLGSIYQQANQFDIAQGLLERSAKLQMAAGGQPSLQLQLQLAAIYLQRSNTDQAYGIYRQVLTAHPDRVDAWKGLIATLQSTNHNTEALQEIALIPTPVRKQLEADFEFVQGEASLYAAAGDVPHAVEYMNRVQAHYAQLKTPMPANFEIQNAWLLYNTRNDRALYPALMRLGSRADLTANQRETVQTIWASWSVRRAGTAIDNNDNQRAVEILEAASLSFPDNLTVRKVLAGGYLRTGQSKEALAIYKSLGMQDASAADFQGAIGAALAANDKTQAEIWLRQALERFPNDAAILADAARFEQARGDNQRAADYWRASLAAMPASSPTNRLAHDLAYPDVNTKPHKASTAADLQRLLDPDYEPFAKTAKLPPLPAYGPDPYNGTAPVVLTPAQPAVSAPQNQIISAPTTTEIDVPAAPSTRSTPLPSTIPQARTPASTRPFPSDTTGVSQNSPPLAGSQTADAKTATNKKSRSRSSGTTSYTGRMNLSPSEENVTPSTPSLPPPARQNPVFIPTPPAVAPPSVAPRSSQSPIYPPGPQSSSSPGSGSQPRLRISAQPMDAKAAQAQALFAEQTDGQLTQGYAGQIRALANAPVSLPANSVHPALGPDGSPPPNYSDMQYTPSAQEAATGAYSAQKPQATTAPTQQPATSAPQQAPPATVPADDSKQARKARRRTSKSQSVPTLVTAPGELLPQVPVPEAVPSATPSTSDTGLTDEELQQRSLPPLRGPWVRVQREKRPIGPREEAEQQLQTLESGYSPWMGGAGVVNYRSGDLGYDHLSALEAPFEISTPLGYNSRLVVVAKPVFLDSGQADGTSVITVQEASTSGTTLVTIPQPLGTDINTGASTTTASTTTPATPPPQQNAAGVGGEVQLVFPHLALAAGYTPYGFLVSNVTGRAQWRPGNGPFTFSFVRDSVKDTQLSYSGLRDPGTSSLSFPGSIWGGVIANQGNVQFAKGDAQSGFYVGVGGQYITGYQVETNNRLDGSGGAYWRVKTLPEYGNLSIGVNFFGMHYGHNEMAYTFGMGGYFSPQEYFLANVPFTWAGHSMTRWHYEVVGGFGVQAFQQDKTSLFPLAAQEASEVAMNNASLAALTSVGPNYNLRGNMAYQVSPHWFAGGFLSANNSRNYASVSAGFSIHYMFRTQPSTVAGPTGLFPSDGLRPFTVP
ncbi:MAG TPA: cellulose synthase subunit BcsC-related outer membrane protein [Terracidiphilus sp.]|jgi:tetratricopeptide (TPR) repeat protein